MQTIDGWDPAAAVVEPSAIVTLGGVVTEVDDVSVTRELAGAAPQSVVGGGGLTGATGSITWSQDDDVTQRVHTPWDSAYRPKSGTNVNVSMGAQDVGDPVPILTGRIDSGSGQVSDGVIGTDLVDDIDRLHRNLTFGPYMTIMPAPSTSPPGSDVRRIGMSGIWVVDFCLRRTGFYSRPSILSGAVMSATMMGSALPEAGDVWSCTGSGGVGTGPHWAVPGVLPGIAATDIDVTYTMQPRTLASPMEVVMQNGGGNSWIWVDFGGVPGSYATGIRLYWEASLIVAQTMVAGVPTDVVSIPRVGATLTVLRVTTSGSNMTLEIRADNGNQASATITPPDGLIGVPVNTARVFCDGTARIGNVQVAFSTTATPFASLNWTPNAFFDLIDIGMYNMQVLPYIEQTDALDLITQAATAYGAAIWLDEQARFRWVGRDALVADLTPVRTLTAVDDLTEVSWSDQWMDAASEVDVSWKLPTVTVKSADTITFWQGSGDTGGAGDVTQDIITPDDGTAWIQPDLNFTQMSPAADMTEYNEGIGSFEGAVLTPTAGDTTAEQWSSQDDSTTTIEQISNQTWNVTTTVNRVLAGYQLNLKGPSSNALGVWPIRYGQALPVVRGRGKFVLTDQTTTSAITGPDAATALTQDAGWWVQSADQATVLADWLAARATVSSPTLDSIEVTYDPRIQLGDVVAVDDPDRSGLHVVGVVFGLTHSVSASGGASTSVTLRPVSVAVGGASLAEYDEIWSGADLADSDAPWLGDTLADFDANPLVRS